MCIFVQRNHSRDRLIVDHMPGPAFHTELRTCLRLAVDVLYSECEVSWLSMIMNANNDRIEQADWLQSVWHWTSSGLRYSKWHRVDCFGLDSDLSSNLAGVSAHIFVGAAQSASEQSYAILTSADWGGAVIGIPNRPNLDQLPQRWWFTPLSTSCSCFSCSAFLDHAISQTFVNWFVLWHITEMMWFRVDQTFASYFKDCRIM